jgi:hypothetical protein
MGSDGVSDEYFAVLAREEGVFVVINLLLIHDFAISKACDSSACSTELAEETSKRVRRSGSFSAGHSSQRIVIRRSSCWVDNLLVELPWGWRARSVQGSTSGASSSSPNVNALKGIRIPSSVKQLESCCFGKRRALSKVEFESESRRWTICKLAFQECTALQEIRIPKSVVTIEDLCSYQCVRLSHVSFERESQIDYLGGDAFDEWSGLVSIRISHSIGRLTLNHLNPKLMSVLNCLITVAC